MFFVRSVPFDDLLARYDSREAEVVLIRSLDSRGNRPPIRTFPGLTPGVLRVPRPAAPR